MCATVFVSRGSALPSICRFLPSAVMRTVCVLQRVGNVISRTRPARSTRFGEAMQHDRAREIDGLAAGATKWESVTRVKVSRHARLGASYPR
jgi:hypothetical protein